MSARLHLLVRARVSQAVHIPVIPRNRFDPDLQSCSSPVWAFVPLPRTPQIRPKIRSQGHSKFGSQQVFYLSPPRAIPFEMAVQACLDAAVGLCCIPR